MQAGIATIYQELDLVAGLSVAENVFLGHEPRRLGFTRPRGPRRRGPRPCSPAGPPRDPGPPRGRPLSAAGQQIVSMARALSHEAR